jgi:membrane protease YdiL (CAAX protease family)
LAWDSPAVLALAGAAGLAVAWLAAAALARTTRRSLSELGFGPRGAVGQGLAGALTGALCMGAAMALFAALGGTSRVAPIAATTRVLSWSGAFLLVAAAQEAIFRGWLFLGLARRIGDAGAAVLSGLLFAAIHVPTFGWSGRGLAAMFVFGLLTCAATRISGALWWAIGFHFAWNLVPVLAIGAGAAGPETAVPTLVVLLLGWAGVVAWGARRSGR